MYKKQKDFFGFNKAINWNKLKDPKVLTELEKTNKLASERASRQKGNMKKKMTMQEAINRIREAVEYYDMVHDTSNQKQNKKNKDYVWKGYDRLVEICKDFD